MKRGHRKTAVGVVTSDRMDKTITVEAERRVLHPRFKKHVRAYSRYKAHDERNEAREGDHVLIMETRPLSKTKRWRLVEILRRARRAGAAAAPPEPAAAQAAPPEPPEAPAAAEPAPAAEGGESQGAEPQ